MALRSQPSRTADLLTRLLRASGVGYLAAAYVVSRYLTRRQRGPVAAPASVGLDAEPLACRTADGLDLAGWAVTPAGAVKGTVALFHGLRQSSGQVLGRAAVLVAAGYRCVAFDHRAHGGSGGKLTSFGFHEANDVAAVAELVRTRWPGERTMAVGLSMGAAAVCYAADRVRWDAVVLESLYADIRSAFASRVGTTYPAWFGHLQPGVIWLTEKRLGVRWSQLLPSERIGELAPAPVLLATGTADRAAPPAEAERLLARCRGPAEMWLVPDAGHKNLLECAGEEYARRVVGFLDRGNRTPG